MENHEIAEHFNMEVVMGNKIYDHDTKTEHEIFEKEKYQMALFSSEYGTKNIMCDTMIWFLLL